MKASANSFHTSDQCQPRLILLKRIYVDPPNRAFGTLPYLVRSRSSRLVSSLAFDLFNGMAFRGRDTEAEMQVSNGVHGATGLPTAAGANVALQDFLEELVDLVV
ncbi:hypothetical protein N7481_003001 [Penicillium waksmanii]|uniref:uncharacterized protein n=1 Tax=Penicillium waksmanii TaxID=69791 RepID=UPI002549BC8C|nr:uncharacterized protein N7481_003001 [Penicillium waksmanii]KAJ5987791.1 hypothetical protein N7481_003001 [Penicillium waksmanii]